MLQITMNKQEQLVKEWQAAGFSEAVIQLALATPLIKELSQVGTNSKEKVS